ncbi:MAG: proline dehydrogenase [Bacteroidetes bacterium GWF2_42_66]|nr:MAG: proline dehydrogenase [Bacteroidetes bacterium GWA2_42_15]OFY02735.1 MAG: proline dehydrogenase [Bacteroidetes bacterium GWE2_42_39]OFY43934.1 MAG: proline dehydrogenase [Bacteroidetes bacterium GWF2_42_66]HBL77251.1 proline dehydrogenase [Prolixibacteraceae bacterium]HCR90627.1 proline dehydrogenase [Prolixibacteraceae bacterium]
MINKAIANVLPYFPKKLIWIFSKRYIAGETIEDGLRVAKELNSEGIEVTIDLLGEFVNNLNQAEEYKNKYISIIERFTSENITGNFSLKPSMFGLLVNKGICLKYIEEIVKKAVEKNSFIRIDMEDSSCVDSEIEIYKYLLHKYPAHVGLVIQAYLRRTISDLVQLKTFQLNGTPLSFRLCKGIYIEPENIAFKKHDEIQDHYIEDLQYMFDQKIHVGIATHDKQLVERAYKLIEEKQIPSDMYEFQMLYGVTPELRKSIVTNGHKMRVYVPFGKEWFGYSTRRLKENPKIASHIIKALFARG